MPRNLRVEYADAIYHVMSRANGKGNIFINDVDRQDFIKTLAEACLKTGFQVHAYCLMRNHFHLVLETPNANLVAGMQWFLSTYTLRLNHRQRLFGHVFSGRYKALVVDGSGNGYLRTAKKRGQACTLHAFRFRGNPEWGIRNLCFSCLPAGRRLRCLTCPSEGERQSA